MASGSKGKLPTTRLILQLCEKEKLQEILCCVQNAGRQLWTMHNAGWKNTFAEVLFSKDAR